MPSRKLTLPDPGSDNLIREIRCQKVILACHARSPWLAVAWTKVTRRRRDSDLAALYGVPTFRFNEAIKRNKNRFPPDFMFQLSQAEF